MVVSQVSDLALQAPDQVLLGLFGALSLLTLARRPLGLPRPVQ